jgi:hypothetical protein
MKKSLFLIVAFIIALTVSNTVFAAYYVHMWHPQHRKYEDGREFNIISLAVRESQGGPYVMSNVIQSITLYDPNGEEVSLTEWHFDRTWKGLFGSFDVNTGQWSFSSDFAPVQPENVIFFDEPLIQGTYHLHVVDTDGTPYDVYSDSNALVDLPMISSRSFRGYEDASGNFIWTWDLPLDLDFWNAGLSTSFRVLIGVYNNGSYMGDLWVTQPTDLDTIIVPSSVMQKLRAEGDTLKARIQLRTDDASNRTYSNEVNIDDLSVSLAGDADGNGRLDLGDSIYILQVLSGVRSP